MKHPATVTAVPPVSRFGVMDAYTQGQVLRFREKPKPNGVISAGFFVFNRGPLDYLGGLECIFERDASGATSQRRPTHGLAP
jgi:glucose-1-phosphate cytidylyltransferase